MSLEDTNNYVFRFGKQLNLLEPSMTYCINPKAHKETSSGIPPESLSTPLLLFMINIFVPKLVSGKNMTMLRCIVFFKTAKVTYKVQRLKTLEGKGLK